MNLCLFLNDLLRGKKVIALVFAIQQAGAQNHLPILEKLAEADLAYTARNLLLAGGL